MPASGQRLCDSSQFSSFLGNCARRKSRAGAPSFGRLDDSSGRPPRIENIDSASMLFFSNQFASLAMRHVPPAAGER
jgi:hypothetical protein